MTNAERQKAYRDRVTAEIVTLRAEVVRLKRELAIANTSDRIHAQQKALTRAAMAPRPKAEASEGTPHGPSCQGVCCRLKRAKGKK